MGVPVNKHVNPVGTVSVTKTTYFNIKSPPKLGHTRSHGSKNVILRLPKARNLPILPVFCKFIEKIGNFGKLGYMPPKIANCYKKALFENRNYLIQKTFENLSASALPSFPPYPPLFA